MPGRTRGRAYRLGRACSRPRASDLTDEERAQWQELTGRGSARVRRVKRAQILWAAQQGHSDAVIAQTAGYEYRRNGTANLFVFLNAHQPWRHVKGTERKTAHDFAHCMHELVDKSRSLQYPASASTVSGCASKVPYLIEQPHHRARVARVRGQLRRDNQLM